MNALVNCKMISIAIVVACAYNADNRKSAEPILMKNSDVHWEGTRYGLMPQIQGNSADVAKNITHRELPWLYKELTNPRSFVAAHIILSQQLPDAWEATEGTWNGLPVDLRADGTVVYAPEGQSLVLNKWRIYRAGTVK